MLRPWHVGYRNESGNNPTSGISVRLGIEYTILDDFHFKASGLVDEQLHGHYLTEDDGRTMSIFPGQRTPSLPDSLRSAPRNNRLPTAASPSVYDDAVVLFGDDGEKFGTWPDTKDHWLSRRLAPPVLRRPRPKTRNGST